MADITLTAALRSNLLSLQGTQSLLDTVQLRLATGRKVNSALDNPSSFFAARSLTNRANDLARLLDGQSQGIQVLKAADQGITSLTKFVEQAQSIAQSARDSVSTSGQVRSGDFTSAIVANITSAGGFTAGNTFTLASSASGVSNATITITAGNTLQQLADSINSNAGFTATIVDTGTTTATFTGGKRIEIRATGGNLTLTNGTGTPLTLLQSGVGAGATVGSTGTGGTITTAVAVTATSNTADEVSAAKQYNAIRTQIDQLISDTGYRGTNLLNGDTLTTKFNETNTSSQTVTGVTFNSSGLGVSAAAFSNSTNIDNAITQVRTALSTLRSQAQTFGNNLSVVQTRQDFTQNLINTLKEGSDKLTLADKNEEGANLLSLQTSQQLGITALSLASQASQSVLRLFG